LKGRSREAQAWRGWYCLGAWRGPKGLRLGQLHREPFCRFCMMSDRVVAATVVDHIRPHRGDRDLFFNAENLQSLCATCHDTTKAEIERRGYHGSCDEHGWPLDPDHPANR